MDALYDTIGIGYAGLRQPDPSIALAISNALADATSVVNVGAGTGSYEPADRWVVSVEPSPAMIKQRPADAAAVIQGTAESLPFRDNSIDASLAILTVHHWKNREKGIGELRRVARDRVVIFTWDPDFPGFWLTDYLPEILDLDRPIFPTIDELRDILGPIQVLDVPIPHDCKDGFMCAYWRRPQAYLDRTIRTAISTFAKMTNVQQRLKKLEEDLHSGAWARRYPDVGQMQEMDCGYRLITAVR